MMWVVTLTYDLVASEDRLVELGALLEEHDDGSVANIPGRGVQLTLWRAGSSPAEAMSSAQALGFSLMSTQPIGVEVVTEAEHERRADEPTLPELVSAPEVAEILGGITRQRVYQLQHVKGFPEPLYRLRTGPVWDRRAIDRFSREWERRPGRPRLVKANA
jgi:hypothetical protein